MSESFSLFILLFLFTGNPLEEQHVAIGDYRDLVAKKLPKLKKLDGKKRLI